MQKLHETRHQLGTPIEIFLRAYDADRARAAMDRAFAQAARIERLYSRFSSESWLSQANARLGEWQALTEEAYELLAFAQRLCEHSGGAFNVGVHSLLEAWGYDPAYSLKESAAPELCRSSFQLRGSAHGGELWLNEAVDLGGLGKGYALDRMLNELADFQHVCIVAGGDLICRGEDENEEGWKVAFEHPTDPRLAIGTVVAKDRALACSSPSRRRWRDRHHLVDPERAQPAENMLAVYTQADAALLADAYATALFVMGFERAQKALPQMPVEALLVSPQGKTYRSEGFEGDLF